MQILKVVIPKGQMPESCWKCDALIQRTHGWEDNVMKYELFCQIRGYSMGHSINEFEYKTERHPDCPLVEHESYNCLNCSHRGKTKDGTDCCTINGDEIKEMLRLPFWCPLRKGKKNDQRREDSRI